MPHSLNEIPEASPAGAQLNQCQSEGLYSQPAVAERDGHLSVCWKKQSFSCISPGCSLTAAFRGSAKRSMRGCMTWDSWNCSLLMSFCTLRKTSHIWEHLCASPRRQGIVWNLSDQMKLSSRNTAISVGSSKNLSIHFPRFIHLMSACISKSL